jgi:hypothetical protein
VATAIEQVNEKVKATADTTLISKVEFLVGDGLDSQSLNKKFGYVVDSGFLHLFDNEQGKVYLSNLKKILPIGDRACFIEFAVQFDIPNTPRAITEKEVLEIIANDDGWKIVHLAKAKNKIVPVQATVFCIERVEG